MNFKAAAAADHVDCSDEDVDEGMSTAGQKKHKTKKKRTKGDKVVVDLQTLDEDTLRQTIREENEFVRRLINTVPPSVYFDAATLAEINAQKHSRAEEKLEVVGLKLQKQLSKKAKLQRTKMDPDQQKSVTEIQEELARQQCDDADEDDEDDEAEEVVTRPTSDRSNSIEELRQRLQKKLASFRGGKAGVKITEAQEKKREERRAKKLKRKEKNKNKSKDAMAPEVKLSKKLKTKENPLARPVFNKDGKMVFSKFDFTETGGAGASSSGKQGKERKGEFSGKDYKKLLSRVQRDKEKLDELREKDESKAHVMQEKTAWKVALDRAEGLKVKTDPDLLKKALKRKEYRKKKTERQWSDRTDQVIRRQDAKQKKRRANIQTRKQDKIKTKIKKAVKRGRLVPGFS